MVENVTKNDKRIDDFSAHSIDRHGVRYKRTLMYEMDVCHDLRQEMVGDISGVAWQFFTSDRAEFIGKCCDADSYADVCRKKVRDLNRRTLTIATKGCTEKFAIRQSAVVSYSVMRPEQTAIIGEFAIKTANRKSALRALIPISNTVREVSFPYNFASHWTARDGWMCISVDIDDMAYVFNGIRYVDGGVKYLAYQHTPREKQHYLVIESLDPIGYDDFKLRILKAISAIGFCTGLYHYGPMYVFNSTSHRLNAYNGCVQKPCNSRYKMFSLNPYEYYSDEDLRPDIGKKLEPSLKPVTMPQFGMLLSHLDNAEFCDLYYAYENVLTRMSSAPVNAKLVMYSSCLEMGRRWALTLPALGRADGATDKSGALLVKKVRKEIKRSIDRILRENKDELVDSDVRIVRKKIGGLYTRPNKDQLKFAFDYFGIGLSKRDEEILGLRNQILHGDSVIQSKFNPKRLSGRYMEECERLCFDFHVLIWRLIMVSIGYDGKYRDVAQLDRLFRKHRTNGEKPLARSVKGRNHRRQH